MLWSLIKLLFFIAIVGGLAWGAIWIMENGPSVLLTVGDIEFSLGPLQAALLAIAGLAALWAALFVIGLIVAVLRFLNGDDTAISRYFRRNRERRGNRAMQDSLMALASGDAKEAIAKARKAEGYLHKPELTNLIVAQAAEMSGDRKRAERTYKELLKNEKTRFVGVRGILNQKLAEGDTDTALKLAKHAFALHPRNEDVQDKLLRLQAEKHDWKGARETLNAKLRGGHIPRDLHRRRDAVLALSQAKDVMDEGKSIEAREAAIKANSLSPDMVPAAVLAARSYIEQGKPRYAARVVKKAWEAQPHPELATAFAEIEPSESPRERVARFEQLLRLKPDHPETKMLKAELMLAAEDFPGARRALGDLATEAPTTRALALMAAIERGQGAGEEVVRGWLAKAVTASRGPQWVCDNCEAVAAEWQPVCAKCHAFDTLSWRTPDTTEQTAGADMLPLLIGATDGSTSAAGTAGNDVEDKIVDLTRPDDAPADAGGPDGPAASDPTETKADPAPEDPRKVGAGRA
jgi:HemY protein